MKIHVSGELLEISEPKVAGKKRITDFIIYQPPLTNTFGERYGFEQYFKVQMIENLESPSQHHRLISFLGKLVTAKCYLNGIKNNRNGSICYHNNLSLVNIDFYNNDKTTVY